MVLFDNVEIGNLNKANEFSAATLQYVNNYLPESGIHIQNSKLGIKNSNPQDDLDVSGVINSKALKTNLLTVWNPNNTANQDAIINLNVAGTSSGDPFIAMNIYNENNAQWSLGIDNVDNLFKIKSSSDFSGSGKLVLNQSGFMGIGVEAPTAPIHLSNTISNKKILLYDVTGNTHQFTGLGIETNSGVDGSLRYQVRQSDVDHIFYSGTSSSSSTELMRIKGNGKIAINETNPNTARLTVNTGNVDEFGLSLVTTLASGKGAGIDLDNRGSGGRNYGIYSANNGSVIIYDKTLNQINFQTGVNGTMIQGSTTITGNTSITGNTNIVGNQNITGALNIIGNTNGGNLTINKNAGPAGNNINPDISIINGSTAIGGSYLYLNKKTSSNKVNQWNASVAQDGIFRISNDILNDVSNPASIKMSIDNTKTEMNGNLNVTGRIKEKGNDLLPVGTILPYAAATPPPGFLLCNGAEYDRAGLYADLFAVIGITYGTPQKNDGTRFKVPDLRCRVPVGLGPNTGGLTEKIIGANAGAETHTLTKNQMPSHNHGGSTQSFKWRHVGNGGGEKGYAHSGGWTGTDNFTDHYYSFGINNDGGGQPHNNMQPYLVINYIIKY